MTVSTRTLAAALRTVHGALPDLLSDEAVRLTVSGLLLRIESTLPKPTFVLWPEDGGWRIGHALDSKVYAPGRGRLGFEVFRAAVSHRSHDLPKATPRARREAVRRAADFVEDQVDCPELAGAMRCCTFSKTGAVRYVDRGRIVIELDSGSRAFRVPLLGPDATPPDDAEHPPE